MQLKWPMLWDLFSLFPAYAGVILASDAGAIYRFAFPRIRGGDPAYVTVCGNRELFSPHTRG